MAVNEYYKVSFVTTRSNRLPNTLKNTGSLIVMSDLTKGSSRQSLWLHGNLISSGWGLSTYENMEKCEWLSKSYNSPFASDEYKGMSYFIPEKGIEDRSYFELGYSSDGKTQVIVARPQTIKSLISYNIKYTYDARNDSYNYTYNICSNLNNDLNDTYTYIKSYMNNILTYANSLGSYLDSYFNTSKTYTYEWIKRIVGGAPDFLDSIEEIKNYLESNRAAGINEFDNIRKSLANKVSHDIKNDDGYCYINAQQSHEEIDKTYTYSATYTYYDYNEDGTKIECEGTYSYYKTKTVDDGILAINAEQVCTGGKFKNIQLDNILHRLLKPYPYEKPELTSISIDDKNPKEWGEEQIEYNDSTFKLNKCIIGIKKNDASTIDLFKFENSNLAVFSEKTSLLEGDNSIDITNFSSPLITINIKSDLINLIGKEWKILDDYTINYGDAVKSFYPQLKDLEILDEDNAFTAGNISGKISNLLGYPIYKKYNFYCWYGIRNINQDVPSNENDLIDENHKFLEKTTTGKLEIDSNIEYDKIWVCIPTVLVDDSNIIIESWNSGIRNNITNISTSMLRQDKREFVYNGINYTTLYLENLEFKVFAEKVYIEVNF